MVFLHQLDQLALGQHHIGDVQAGKFGLAGAGRDRQVFDEPIIQRAVILEFQGTQGMGHAFDRIALTMGKVIHGIDVPGIACARMVGMQDAI